MIVNDFGFEVMAKKKIIYDIHLVSDSTGNLAEHLFQSVISQFPKSMIKKTIHRFVNSIDKINKLKKKISPSNSLVLHALVDPKCKNAISEFCRNENIPAFDLTGSLVGFISDHIKVLPENSATNIHPADKAYFDRIRAMEFTAQHDDGRRVESINEADIIIFGISRVSKSPTSTFLGSLGYKVANIAVTNETNLKRDFKGIKRKAIALTTIPAILKEIRTKRFERFNIGKFNYVNMREISQEVMLAEEKYTEMGWPILDVTGMTIEETSARIIELKKLKRKPLAD